MRSFAPSTVAALLAFPGPAWAAFAQQMARGVVFDDVNHDGRQQPGEPGLEGVAVSNQDQVVLTDAQGRYALPVTDETILFVTVPAGWGAPVDSLGRPRFYYIHHPKGSPRLFYGGVAPTGRLPHQVDFPLERHPRDTDAFTLLVLADPQPATWQELDWLEQDVLSELVGTQADLGVVLGDLVFDRLDLFRPLSEALARVGVPFHVVLGNHDIDTDAPDQAASDDTFERFFGPSWYSFERGKVHFVALNTIRWQPNRRHWTPGISDRQLGWLAQDLAHVPKDDLVVLLTHVPILDPNLTPEGQRHRPIPGSDRLLELLRDRTVLALSGHTHTTARLVLGPDDGWKGRSTFEQLVCTTGAGAWWSGPFDERGIPSALQADGTPNGTTLVDFDGSHYRLRFRPASQSAREQLRIYPQQDAVVVNVFMGAEDTRVEWRLDDGDWQPMTRTPGKDPLAVSLYSGARDLGKPFVDPVVTPHLWRAPLADLDHGTHLITVRATFGDGRTFSSSRIFRR